jgi:hypothetical protein
MNTETTAYIARLQRELREAHVDAVRWRGLALASVLGATLIALWSIAVVIL